MRRIYNPNPEEQKKFESSTKLRACFTTSHDIVRTPPPMDLTTSTTVTSTAAPHGHHSKLPPPSTANSRVLPPSTCGGKKDRKKRRRSSFAKRRGSSSSNAPGGGMGAPVGGTALHLLTNAPDLVPWTVESDVAPQRIVNPLLELPGAGMQGFDTSHANKGGKAGNGGGAMLPAASGDLPTALALGSVSPSAAAPRAVDFIPLLDLWWSRPDTFSIRFMAQLLGLRVPPKIDPRNSISDQIRDANMRRRRGTIVLDTVATLPSPGRSQTLPWLSTDDDQQLLGLVDPTYTRLQNETRNENQDQASSSPTFSSLIRIISTQQLNKLVHATQGWNMGAITSLARECALILPHDTMIGSFVVPATGWIWHYESTQVILQMGWYTPPSHSKRSELIATIQYGKTRPETAMEIQKTTGGKNPSATPINDAPMNWNEDDKVDQGKTMDRTNAETKSPTQSAEDGKLLRRHSSSTTRGGFESRVPAFVIQKFLPPALAPFNDDIGAGDGDEMRSSPLSVESHRIIILLTALALEYARACGVLYVLIPPSEWLATYFRTTGTVCDLSKCNYRYAFYMYKQKIKQQRQKQQQQQQQTEASPLDLHADGASQASTTTRLRWLVTLQQQQHQQQDETRGKRTNKPMILCDSNYVSNDTRRVQVTLLSPDKIKYDSVTSQEDPEGKSTRLPDFHLVKWFEPPNAPSPTTPDLQQQLESKLVDLERLEASLQPKLESLLCHVVTERLVFEQSTASERRKQARQVLEENIKMIERRRESDLAFQKQLEQDMDAVCAICNDGEVTPDNQILFCESCNVAVHQICYGIEVVPEGDYYCMPCTKLGRHKIQDVRGAQAPMIAPLPICCELCPQKQGAFIQTHFKPTSNRPSDSTNVFGKWVHVVCAKWQGLNFISPERTDLIEDVTDLKFRFREHGIVCCLCLGERGSMNKCRFQGCSKWAHVTCARAVGNCEVIHGENAAGAVEVNPWTLLCPDHSNITDIPPGSTPIDSLILLAKEFPPEPPPPPPAPVHKPFNLVGGKEREELLRDHSYEQTLLAELTTKIVAGCRCEVCDVLEDDINFLHRCSSCFSICCKGCVFDPKVRDGALVCAACTFKDRMITSGGSEFETPHCLACFQNFGILLEGWARPVSKKSYWHANPKEFKKSLFGKPIWVHTVCALWNPKLAPFIQDGRVCCSDVIMGKGNSLINANTFCQLCGHAGGLKVRCNYDGCSSRKVKSCEYFHVTCARQAGLEVNSTEVNGDAVLFVHCYQHCGNEYNFRAKIEDLLEIERRRAGKELTRSHSPMNKTHAGRLLNASIHAMKILGWSWRWAEWWVDHNSSWEPLLEPGQVESKMTKEELKIIDSTRESRCEDARKCRLSAFGAALQERKYDTDEGFDNDSLHGALNAVFSTASLVGPLEANEKRFVVDWLARAYRSKSKYLGFGQDRIPPYHGNNCLHIRDNSPKFSLGSRPLPGRNPPPEGFFYEIGVDEVDEFLLSDIGGNTLNDPLKQRDSKQQKATSRLPMRSGDSHTPMKRKQEDILLEESHTSTHRSADLRNELIPTSSSINRRNHSRSQGAVDRSTRKYRLRQSGAHPMAVPSKEPDTTLHSRAVNSDSLCSTSMAEGGAASSPGRKTRKRNPDVTSVDDPKSADHSTRRSTSKPVDLTDETLAEDPGRLLCQSESVHDSPFQNLNRGDEKETLLEKSMKSSDTPKALHSQLKGNTHCTEDVPAGAMSYCDKDHPKSNRHVDGELPNHLSVESSALRNTLANDKANRSNAVVCQSSQNSGKEEVLPLRFDSDSGSLPSKAGADDDHGSKISGQNSSSPTQRKRRRLWVDRKWRKTVELSSSPKGKEVSIQCPMTHGDGSLESDAVGRDSPIGQATSLPNPKSDINLDFKSTSIIKENISKSKISTLKDASIIQRKRRSEDSAVSNHPRRDEQSFDIDDKGLSARRTNPLRRKSVQKGSINDRKVKEESSTIDFKISQVETSLLDDVPQDSQLAEQNDEKPAKERIIPKRISGRPARIDKGLKKVVDTAKAHGTDDCRVSSFVAGLGRDINDLTSVTGISRQAPDRNQARSRKRKPVERYAPGLVDISSLKSSERAQLEASDVQDSYTSKSISRKAIYSDCPLASNSEADSESSEEGSWFANDVWAARGGRHQPTQYSQRNTPYPQRERKTIKRYDQNSSEDDV